MNMINLKCLLCGQNQQLKEMYKATFNLRKLNPMIFSARRNPDGMHYRIVRCQNCSLVFSNPILELGKINALYKQSKFEYQLESDFLKQTYKFYFKQIIPKKFKNIRLLEIGCGNGFFLEEIKKMGINNFFGIEPSKDAVAKAKPGIKKKIKIDILKSGIFKNDSFDIICCFHTLDHIIKPDLFIKETFKLLRKKGKVFFVVHNVDSISVRLFGDKSPIIDIEHIYLFNRQTLPQIFQKNGFRIVKVFDIKNRYPLNYWVKMSPFPKTIRLFLNKTFDILNIGNLPFSFKGGNIGIYAEKL